MAGAFRTDTGGRVDRAASLAFEFDGRAYTGLSGDTLASALLANGVHLVGRSFKYHRPRGILAAGCEEPNALVRVMRGAGRETPNLRATQVELYAGLAAESQNRWPGLRADAGALAGLAAPLLPAGFYYKTFMGPGWPGATVLWSRVFEPLIRRAAGLGRAPSAPDPDAYLNRYAHCEVLVIGAGPAGLAAALAAAERGGRVILCDEQSEPGGSLLAETEATIDGEPAAAWLAGRLEKLEQAGVTVMPRTTAFGCYAANFVALAERLSEHRADVPPGAPRERLWQVRAREVVFATGALERPLVFRNNDRPGILLADAARTYLNRYGVRVGRRAVVATACDSAYGAALELAAAGVEIPVICDLRATPPARLREQAEQAGIAVRAASAVLDTRGRLRVSNVSVASLDGHARREAFACDTLLVSGGWTPVVALQSQSRGRLGWDAERLAYVPVEHAPRQHSAGACRGTGDLAKAIAEGRAAGRRASGQATDASPPPVVSNAASTNGSWLGLPSRAAPPPGRAFVDFQNDVTASDLAVAVREGFRAIEHVKRYTTTGMATDQGKTSNLNALAIVANMTGTDVPAVGMTSFRAPYTPVTFGTLAGTEYGELLAPVRKTPMHAWAAARGAVFEDVGLWRRAQYFPRPGEDRAAAVARECRTTRASVGLFDASTLGKIEVVGPDACEFLERLYVNRLATLAPGRCRYAVLLNEAGFIVDDGIIARLAPDRFHVTTTTGGAGHVLAKMEDYLQTEWPDLAVWLTSVTEHWAVAAVQGPRAREVLARAVPGLDADVKALPHMAVSERASDGIPMRLFRASFTGELGFELNVPAGSALGLWVALHEAAEAVGGGCYGTDAMHVMRAEKGYIIVGQDTDGTMVPDDVGLGRLVDASSKDFVGRRSLARAHARRADRPQLVGLLSTDGRTRLEEGSQVTATPDPATGSAPLGFVSSAYDSAAAGRPIALALVAGGRARLGERVFVPAAGGAVPAEIVAPVFYDPEGARLNG